jgi:hypothetical protein
VRATWDPEAPLEGRVMHLELRLRRLLGVHTRVLVTRVWDEEREEDGRRARAFGYEYATLAGHVEMGRMDYEVWEWLDDGAVEFRIHSHSRAWHDGPAWARLGLRLFGRREQARFYRRCCERMALLASRALGVRTPPPAPVAVFRDGERPGGGRARRAAAPPAHEGAGVMASPGAFVSGEPRRRATSLQWPRHAMAPTPACAAS